MTAFARHSGPQWLASWSTSTWSLLELLCRHYQVSSKFLVAPSANLAPTLSLIWCMLTANFHWILSAALLLRSGFALSSAVRQSKFSNSGHISAVAVCHCSVHIGETLGCFGLTVVERCLLWSILDTVWQNPVLKVVVEMQSIAAQNDLAQINH